ncbi:MAG: type I-E CRISPR-associated endoribonuclease Cas2e [Chloroflexota bacterium]
MVVLVLEKVPVGLRGELTRWLLELRAGVFVGDVSAMVREKLWEKACESLKEGGAILAYNSDSEQGFSLRLAGATDRLIEDFEGLQLVRKPA